MRIAILVAFTACNTAAQPTMPDHEHSHAHHDHHGGMPHRFEHADDWAKELDDPARDQWQQPDKVLAALGLAPTLTVADVGAGTGYFTMRIARALTGGTVIANDIEPDMIRYLTERASREHLPNVRAVLGTSDDPHLDPASVDRILVVDVWHHLADRPAYAKRLAAALKPGGWIAIVDFKAESEHGPPKEMRLAPPSIVADLRAAGLDASVDPTVLPEQYVVVGRAR